MPTPEENFHEEFHQHLQDEHQVSHFGEYLKEIVYGGTDGLVTTFAIVAGFSGANLGVHLQDWGTTIVLLFGFANLLADGVSMGLGNFLSLRSQRDLYHYHRRKEEREIKKNPHFERAETIEILQQRGVSLSDAEKFADLYQRNPQWWADFMMDYEVEIPDMRNERPAIKGLVTFGSFIIFGAIPLLPYLGWYKGDFIRLFESAIIATLSALLLLGVLRWRVTRQSWWRCIGETILVGGACAVVAYGVGTFF